MNLALSLIPVLLAVLIVACFFKLAAWLFRRTVVSWSHCLLFGLVLLGISAANLITGRVFPIEVSYVFGLALTIAAGSWFFSTRAKTAQGEHLGWRGSLQFTGIAVGLMAGVGIALMLLPNALRLSPS